MLEDLTIQMIAEHMNYSVDWLCHYYKKVTGHSIGETIIRQKLDSAAKEIQDKKYSILEISLKYGYETQEGFCRAFKKYFGVVPRKYKKCSVDEEERKKVITMYDKMIFEEIKCYTVEEKIKLLDSIDMILNYSQKVKCFGIFSLEKELTGIDNKFLKKGLQMMIDGLEPEIIKQILWNYIWCNSQKPAKKMERVIFLEGILAIQEGTEENIIREKLLSFLGEDFIETAEEHYRLSNEMLEQKRNDYLLKMEIQYRKDTDFEKTINKMNERSLQRLLREIDIRTLAEAVYDLNGKTIEKVLKNVSNRIAINIIDELEKVNGINTLIKKGAQDYILKMIHKLIESKDIVI